MTSEVYGISTEKKLIILMIMLQMINHLNIGKTPEHSRNEGDANRPGVLTLNLEVTIPLQYFSNFRRFLDVPLKNCEIELDLS